MKKLLPLFLLASASSFAQHYLPQIVQDAADGMLTGCEVKLRVDGWANQLYVNGQFAGNFRDGSEDYNLARAIDNHIYNRNCSYKSSYEVQIMNDPYLIEDFANYQYRNCYVKLNVDGWANQIYIYDRFSGNFHNRTEVNKLKAALAGYIVNGTCVKASTYPSPSPNPYPVPHPYPQPGPRYPAPRPYPQPGPRYPAPRPYPQPHPYPQPGPRHPQPRPGYCPDPNTHYDARLGRCVR